MNAVPTSHPARNPEETAEVLWPGLQARPSEKLASTISFLADYLPAPEPFEQRAESEAYGATWQIAKRLGLQSVPWPNALWIHAIPLKLDASYFYVNSDSQYQLLLVANQLQVELLAGRGYGNCLPVGMPFIYAPAPPVPRQKRSLLVALGTTFLPDMSADAWRSYQLEYVRALQGLRSDFDTIVALVKGHGNTDGAGWYELLEENGIPWVKGASLTDKNALARMRLLFSSFEVVTSNTWTGALAYAAYAGARSCIWGPAPPNMDLTFYFEDRRGKLGNEVVDREISLGLGELVETMGNKREAAYGLQPELFAHPAEAPLLDAWAQDILGGGNKLSDPEIARVLGWQHCATNEAFEGIPRTRYAASLGWLPDGLSTTGNHLQASRMLTKEGVNLIDALQERERLKKQVGKLEVRLETSQKRLERAEEALRGRRQEVAATAASWAWKFVGKPAHSIEKRVRSLFGKPVAAGDKGSAP